MVISPASYRQAKGPPVSICTHKATSLQGARNKLSCQLSKRRLAALSNATSYIPKYNGLQHFESNKMKYAPKYFENRVYKEAVLSEDNRSSSHRRNAAYKSQHNKKRAV